MASEEGVENGGLYRLGSRVTAMSVRKGLKKCTNIKREHTLHDKRRSYAQRWMPVLPNASERASSKGSINSGIGILRLDRDAVGMI